MKILAIETSHDDSSLSIVENKKIVYLKTLSQADFFAKFGGTIPELASRQHVHNLLSLIDEVKKKNLINNLDCIAYTKEPGLLGTLHIGYLAAQALALTFNLPLIAINHLEGHFYSGLFEKEYQYPVLGIVVSGGHSLLIKSEFKNDFTIMGNTLDDALGEVLDKIANRLGIGFPGGPAIEKLCKDENYRPIKLNQVKTKQYDLSFSGIKSQVVNLWNSQKYTAKDLACSLQKHLINLLLEKVDKLYADYQFKSVVIGGGVSANQYLREQISKKFTNVIIPPLYLATDNAAMIAAAAWIKIESQKEKK